MSDDHADLLADAVARNSAAVLSLPSAGMLRHHKSRLLAHTFEGLWVESAATDGPLIDELMLLKTPVGVSFKAAPTKASFAVPILRREASYQLSSQAIVEALLLESPSKIKPVQRRSNYRVRVPEGSPLSVRIWRIADHVLVRDRPLASLLVNATVKDLSVGGMGIMIHRDPSEKRTIQPGQRLRIELKWEETELILEGALRIATAEAGENIRGGVQFKKLENDLIGRQAAASLTRIVGELQRDEVRRTRLGI